MDVRLKIVVALVVGFFLELLNYQVLLHPWMGLELHGPLVNALADVGLGSVARHFGLVWSRVPEWGIGMVAGVVIALRIDEKRRSTIMACAMGVMIGGLAGPLFEGYGETYGRWAMKFTAAYVVLGLGTLMFAGLGGFLGAWAGGRGDD